MFCFLKHSLSLFPPDQISTTDAWRTQLTLDFLPFGWLSIPFLRCSLYFLKTAKSNMLCRIFHVINLYFTVVSYIQSEFPRVLNVSLQFLQSAHAAPANRSWPQSKLLAISSNCEALCESIVYCQHFTMIEKIKRQAGLWWFSKCILDVSRAIHYMDYHIKY